MTTIEVRPVVLPVPDRLTNLGLPNPLSLIVSVPVRVPTIVGVNVIPTAQVDPAATLVQVLLLMAKSPLAITDETVRDVLN